MWRLVFVNENCVQGNVFKFKGDSFVVIVRKNYFYGVNEFLMNFICC